MNSKASKLLGLFLIITVGFIIFLARVFDVATSTRFKDIATKREIDTPLRGDIVTADGYQVAKSQKRYSVNVDPGNIDPTKKELFIKLISVYSKQSPAQIQASLMSNSDKVVLISGIDAREAKNFRQLSSVLDRMKVFIPKQVGSRFLRYGLEITENEFFREYPYKDSMEPLLGYINMENMNGLLGLEKFYDGALVPTQGGLVVGQRDAGGNIIFNEKTKNSFRQDGMSISLFINLKLQKEIELILDNAKSELGAESVMACVMDSKTGHIFTLASSNRYIPYNLSQASVPNMKVDFVQQIYEPGSTIKPIIFSILLENKKVNINEQIDCKLGSYKIGSKTIVDEHKMGIVPAQDAVIFSSNVGMSQLMFRIDPNITIEWLKRFGLSQKSGIDLPYELDGDLPKKSALSSDIVRGILGYGYGLRCNFIQLMSAYNVFNNDGVMITPRITRSIVADPQTEYSLPKQAQSRIISENTYSKIHRVLLDVVQKGTGVKAQVPGIEIGGKTGTAHIAKNGVYANSYNSSFFGFANDTKSRYTIGVLVIEPKAKHFAADTAVPVFKNIILKLQDDGLLSKPEVIQAQ